MSGGKPLQKGDIRNFLADAAKKGRADESENAGSIAARVKRRHIVLQFRAEGPGWSRDKAYKIFMEKQSSVTLRYQEDDTVEDALYSKFPFLKGLSWFDFRAR